MRDVKLLLVAAVASFAALFVMLLIMAAAGWPDSVDVNLTPELATPVPSTRIIMRELTCQEDEDIVTSLGNNGLMVSWCQQVVER